LKHPQWHLNTIKTIARRESIKVFGISAITHGFNDGGVTRKFQNKKGMWLTFKKQCGMNCKIDGLTFLPRTFDMRNSTDVAAFKRYFSSSRTYVAKISKRDAKKGLKLYKGATSLEVLNKIKSDERRSNARYNIVQEFINNPALAKYPASSSKGFKVNMRVYLVLTCSREKREWAMLRAGSELHYALNHYSKNLNPRNKASFLAAVDTSYWVDDLVMKGHIKRASAHNWPSSAIAYLENLKKQGWTNSVEKEWKKIEAIFKKSAEVYEGKVCNSDDKAILRDVDRMFHLIGADILMAGNVGTGGRKSLQPYLIEWNAGPGFLDYGNPMNLEHLQITQMAALYKGGVVQKPWWLPQFQQKEYRHITATNFATTVYKNVWKKTTPW